MRSILLYSSGFDSELYRLLEKPEKLLFFSSGAQYEAKEYQQVQHFINLGLINKDDVIIDRTLDFKGLEFGDHVIPMRNIFYLLRAFTYSQNVYLGINYYDVCYDKRRDTLNALESFIKCYYYGRDLPPTWTSDIPEILTPYKDFTKGEILAEAIQRGIDVSHIPFLRTCYDPSSEIGCGRCSPCMHKAMALAVNGMFKPEYFDSDPRYAVKERRKILLAEKDDDDSGVDPEVLLSDMDILLSL